MNKRNRFIIQSYFEVLTISLALAFSIYVGPLINCLSFYVHEGGHIIFGILGNVFYEGIVPEIRVMNYITCPFPLQIPLPQQVRLISGTSSAAFIFGGAAFTIITFTAISVLLFDRNRSKAFVLFPIIFFFHELFGNVLCGTDNFFGQPHLICKSGFISQYIVEPTPFYLTAAVFLVTYPYISAKILASGLAKSFYSETVRKNV
jgi:hypothetical protein